jgi:phosphate:Na+ symporter
MEDAFDFWKFFAGVGLFLWGMSQLETRHQRAGGKVI